MLSMALTLLTNTSYPDAYPANGFFSMLTTPLKAQIYKPRSQTQNTALYNTALANGISHKMTEQLPEELVLKNRKQEIEKMFLSQGIEFGPIIFTLSTLVILYYGWTTDLENYITAESGIGYMLGIVGTTMMLITLLYSLRKRMRSMRNWGLIRNWFTIHMILGIYGPVLTLYHCNYSIGSSQNEKIAVISMIVVVISGIIGRYIHDKIRYGLYKHEAALEQLQMAKLITEDELSSLHKEDPKLFKEILKHDSNIQIDSSGLIKSFFRILKFNTATRISYALTKKEIKIACKEIAIKEQWTPAKYKATFHKANHFLTAHYATIRKIASYSFYERIFSIWFFLHIPLFYMLIVSIAFHIWAVHQYSAHTF